MILSLPENEMINYVFLQLNHFFPDGKEINKLDYKKDFTLSLYRLENCFKHINNKNYCIDGKTYFNYLHSDQYAMFIWFLSNTIWNEKKDSMLSNKLFYLNKIFHGFSCMYDTKLPDIFILFHAVGTVLGKAEYSNYFVATHGCTVGAHNNVYPKIGENVAMLTNSSIIGDCVIGNNVSIGAHTKIYNQNIKNNIVAFTTDKGEVNYKYNKHICWSEKNFI
ncbi:hypothetical protein [Clostridium sp. JS66]|uniref:hypothetical protein n=1 Tax=Clostridium sp. JS66 TaxID=3064705 RepID=UPI00298D8194|nr:hypothetical protein [Clostridium sp. JS66]WPC41054.1 hypothetical protein Q6H37_24660 [Clostridium sp. JS66]